MKGHPVDNPKQTNQRTEMKRTNEVPERGLLSIKCLSHRKFVEYRSLEIDQRRNGHDRCWRLHSKECGEKLNNGK